MTDSLRLTAELRDPKHYVTSPPGYEHIALVPVELLRDAADALDWRDKRMAWYQAQLTTAVQALRDAVGALTVPVGGVSTSRYFGREQAIQVMQDARAALTREERP